MPHMPLTELKETPCDDCGGKWSCYPYCHANCVETKDMEISRLTARLEVMTKANQMWLDKWERMECEWCGTTNMIRETTQEARHLDLPD